MAFGRGGNNGTFVDNGSKNKTAMMKKSKNGKDYIEVTFSDKETSRVYTVRIFAWSSYVPTKSSKSYRNGKTCYPAIISSAIYQGQGGSPHR